MTLLIELFENPFFGLLVLPLLIFVARVADVSLGTLRIVFISQGRKNIAPLVGFLEVFIWLLAIGQIFNNLTNILYYIAFAGGFALGNYVGLIIEDKISLGLLNLQLILSENPDTLIKTLKSRGYGLTSVTAEGAKGNVKVVITVIKRKNKAKILEIIRELSPNAFISIQQIQSVTGGKFPFESKMRYDLLKRLKK
ncbi:MAG: DUF2179 domain-containing protein [Promethearchaeota archaeon]|nr:MAG: DUF2179 domain-containing protein [Candidatus Lokiarchaeota archaeon]